VLTPRIGDRSSLVLLSPARTISETLTALAATTAQQLEEVWDEVGYSPEDRAAQLSDLLAKFRDACEAKIAEERGVAETFRQTIADAKEELRKTGEALKSLVDPHMLRENNNQTLMDELSSLEAAVENIREEAKAARDDLKQCSELLKDSHRALGLKLDDRWLDVESDLTFSRREEFRRKVSEMREDVSTRTSAIIQLVKDCQDLINELRIDTQQNPLDRRIVGSLVRSKHGDLIMTSLIENETCVGISSASLDALTERIAQLHNEKNKRVATINEIGESIYELWQRLRISETEQKAFAASVDGIGTDTIEKGEAELERLQSLKAKMLGNLVWEAREMIQNLWEEMNATDEEKKSFQSFAEKREEMFTNELLEKHEEYIQLLNSKLEHMRPILRIIERRECIIRERMELEELQKDPERLQQRGAAMTRQLMEEEKMAKRIKRELPKLTQMLDEKLQEWKNMNGEDFKYRGNVYLKVIEEQEEEWQQYKENETQLKLKKKQEEKASVENRFQPSASFRSLAAKAKPAPGVSKPLADGRNRDNTANTRAPSRQKVRCDANPNNV
jgi:protein regulator of cytokinesis 1